jgi:GNAT superfamily N-acetyltransferase
VLEVRPATVADRRDVIRVMAAAFDDDPVIRWMVPPGRSLVPLFRAHLRTSDPAQQYVDLALSDGVPVGAAIWQQPAYHLATWRQVVSLPWYTAALGRHLPRGAVLESVTHKARPDVGFWYLAGVGAARRGEGIGSALLGHRLDRIGHPAYLESSKRENLALYQRFGFDPEPGHR